MCVGLKKNTYTYVHVHIYMHTQVYTYIHIYTFRWPGRCLSANVTRFLHSGRGGREGIKTSMGRSNFISRNTLVFAYRLGTNAHRKLFARPGGSPSDRDAFPTQQREGGGGGGGGFFGSNRGFAASMGVLPPPPAPPVVCHKPYTIGIGNSV